VLTLTYLVVLMSILLQGLTVGRVVCALYGRRAEPATDETH
jgi:CPA1 family monovalent cation:H+ antiporter